MDVEEIIDQILLAVDEIEGMQCRGQWSNKKWTLKIKTALCNVGIDNGYDVCAAGVDNANHGEWLYDVCWLNYDDDGMLESMQMVAESEWGRNIGDIEDDFSKLLVARAALRVMVCDGRHLPGGEQGISTAERLREWVGAYNGNRAGDTYLLIVYEGLHSWRYRLDVNQAGEVQNLN